MSCRSHHHRPLLVFGGSSSAARQSTCAPEDASIPPLRHNPHITVGLYAGLGKPISWQPPEYNPKAAHAFWDASNLARMTVKPEATC
jgi:hypothetical protein